MWILSWAHIFLKPNDPEKNTRLSQAMVAHAFNPAQEAGGSLWVRDQPGLQELAPGQEPKATEKPCLKNPIYISNIYAHTQDW